MEKYRQQEEPEERPELKGRLETTAEGTLIVRGSGVVGHGEGFTRITNPLNENCPEYQAGQLALAAGYAPFEKVDFEIRIKPKKNS